METPFLSSLHFETRKLTYQEQHHIVSRICYTEFSDHKDATTEMLQQQGNETVDSRPFRSGKGHRTS
jgi:hypothetical protein